MGKRRQEVFSFNPRNPVTVSTGTTLTSANDQVDVTGTTTITLPVISTGLTGLKKGVVFYIRNTGSAVVTITPGTGDTINGASTWSLDATNESNPYVIIRPEKFGVNNWIIDDPAPVLKNNNLEADVITGGKLVTGALYQSVATATSGTTAQNVFGSGGAPCALTVTSVTAVAKDTNAGNMILTNGTNAVATFAKSTTAGVVTGEDGALANTAVAAGAIFTVESSTTNGDGLVIVSYTVT
jgi:hypothetical protein